MAEVRVDGGTGDANYGVIGSGYTVYRQSEPAIAALIQTALDATGIVLNVGAGAGSYEPTDRTVVAVEPSSAMRSQRPSHLPSAINAHAENLPFADGEFSSAMATFTVHQWSALDRGLREMRRVTRGPIVILTCDPDLVQRFWLNEYAPGVLATEARRYPRLDRIGTALGGDVQVFSVPVPLLCRDGFNEAYYGRPEALLRPDARMACSAWSFVDATTAEHCVEHLRRDLSSGKWDRQHGHLRTQPNFDGSLRLIVGRP